eukprot:g33700.t1
MSRIQGQYIPVRVNGKADRFRDPWLTRDTDALVRKKKSKMEFKLLGLSESLDDYKKCRSTLKRETRRAKRDYEMDLKKGNDPKRQLSCSSDAAWPAVFIQ